MMAIARPVGLEAIYTKCRELYPDQPNPLQIAAVVKYWLGGPDPLDFLNIYRNPGDTERGYPPHWHYITCGLSDLYGDNRVHEANKGDGYSGFGLELTFRLSIEDSTPPSWPAELLQALARYVFQSGNQLCCGDHISWHKPLDQGESLLQHMLLAQDPQLLRMTTPLGNVIFTQVVGVMSSELEAAQKWNVQGILDLLTKLPLTGGDLLITNMRRGESLFDIDPDTQMYIEEGISKDGSTLSGVTAVCGWEDSDGLKGGGAVDDEGGAVVGGVPHSEGINGSLELLHTRTLEAVHMNFNLEASRLILLALRGRLKHNRHFTFKSITGDVAITFVSPGIQGAFADPAHTLAAQGPWLQVYLSPQDIDTILTDLSTLLKENVSLPHKVEWPDKNISITVVQ